MKNKMKKILAIIVCISFILTFLPSSSISFAKPNNSWKDKIKVLDADKKLKKAEVEYEGYKYIATLDKDTNEIKLKVKPIKSKKSDVVLDTLSSNEERNFSVKVEYFDGENLKAKLIDDVTKEEYNIGDSNTVSGQFVIALPLALGLVEALISALLAIGEAIVLCGVTYVVVTKVLEKVRNSKYDYYMAMIKKGNVFIGPAIDFSTACAIVMESPTTPGDVFARTESLAKSVAEKVAGSLPEKKIDGVECKGKPVGPERHRELPNYFPHFHVEYADKKTGETKQRFPAHIFFPY